MDGIFKVFTGVVEDRMDPMKIGRVRVRCFFIHPIDKTLVPTEDLPWARVSVAGLSLKEGDQVKGYFDDPGDYQLPVVNEKISGVPEDRGSSDNGFSDPRKEEELAEAPRFPKDLTFTPGQKVQVTEQDAAPRQPARLNEPLTNRLARNENLDTYLEKLRNWRLEDVTLGIQSLLEGMATSFLQQVSGALISRANALISQIPGISIANTLANAAGFNKFQLPTTYTQPQVPYNAKYPYNHANVSESGHVHEIDDTPGAERIHTRHRSGTYDEMLPDGDRVIRTAGDQHNIVSANGLTVVQGYRSTLVEGSDQVIVRGAKFVQIEGGSKVVIMGDAQVSVTGDMSHNVQGNYTLNVGGNYTVTSTGDATISSQTKSGVYSLVDVEVMATGKLKFTVVDDWEMKLVGGLFKLDMLQPGKTNMPINLNPVTNLPIEPDLTAPVFTSDEFTNPPQVVSDVEQKIEEAVDAAAEAGTDGTLTIDISANSSTTSITADKVGSYW